MMPTFAVRVGTICPRCGVYHTIETNFKKLCDACCSVLMSIEPIREHIIAAYQSQYNKVVS